MALALKLSLVFLSFAVFGRADVSHLGYRRYSRQRLQPLRLQRLEAESTPYPAAGYRPNREFNLPREQPLFPLVNQQSSRPQVSSGFDSLSEPQRPQLLYGAPIQEPRFSPRNRPQNVNGFNNLAEPQQHEFVDQTQFLGGNIQSQNNNRGYNNVLNNSEEPRQPQDSDASFNNFEEPQNPQTSNNGFNNGFNNLAEPQQPQQSPELLYGAPNNQEQQEPQSGLDNLSEPQYNYNIAPARLRQQLVARLQRAQRIQQLQQQYEAQDYRQSQSQSQSQQQQQFVNSPQTLYRAPSQQTQAQSESQSSRLIAQKAARLTDNREETEEESDAKTSETVEEIETTTKAEDKKTVNGTVPVVANTGVVSYYPATAFGFVQPISAAYVASANYQTVQPVSAAYTVSSPFLPQQYTLAAASPTQLQAW